MMTTQLTSLLSKKAQAYVANLSQEELIDPNTIKDNPYLTPTDRKKLSIVREVVENYYSAPFNNGDYIKSTVDASKHCHALIGNKEQESLLVVLINTKGQIIDSHIVSIGTINKAIAHPRDVFREAIRQNASRIILSHNHPSGDTLASGVDHEMTKRMREVGDLVGIELIDHIIVGPNPTRSYSFAELVW